MVSDSLLRQCSTKIFANAEVLYSSFALALEESEGHSVPYMVYTHIDITLHIKIAIETVGILFQTASGVCYLFRDLNRGLGRQSFYNNKNANTSCKSILSMKRVLKN